MGVKQRVTPTSCHINLSPAELHVRTISLSTKRSKWYQRALPLLLRLNARFGWLGLYFTDRFRKGLQLLKIAWLYIVYSNSESISPEDHAASCKLQINSQFTLYRVTWISNITPQTADILQDIIETQKTIHNMTVFNWSDLKILDVPTESLFDACTDGIVVSLWPKKNLQKMSLICSVIASEIQSSFVSI